MNGDKLNLPELAKYGLTGVALLLIVLVGFTIFKLCELQDRVTTLMENHFVNNTAALEQLKSAVDQSTAVSQQLKDYLIKKNGN
jgi:hypothetical protein